MQLITWIKHMKWWCSWSQWSYIICLDLNFWLLLVTTHVIRKGRFDHHTTQFPFLPSVTWWQHWTPSCTRACACAARTHNTGHVFLTFALSLWLSVSAAFINSLDARVHVRARQCGCACVCVLSLATPNTDLCKGLTVQLSKHRHTDWPSEEY